MPRLITCPRFLSCPVNDVMQPHPLQRPQKASGRISSKISTSYRQSRCRRPFLRRWLKFASSRTAKTGDNARIIPSLQRALTFVARPIHPTTEGILMPSMSASSSSLSVAAHWFPCPGSGRPGCCRIPPTSRFAGLQAGNAWVHRSCA